VNFENKDEKNVASNPCWKQLYIYHIWQIQAYWEIRSAGAKVNQHCLFKLSREKWRSAGRSGALAGRSGAPPGEVALRREKWRSAGRSGAPPGEVALLPGEVALAPGEVALSCREKWRAPVI
jgi:hypothetical protein